MERIYQGASMVCEDGYTKIFSLGARYGHLCIRMAYGEYEAACASPSYSLGTDAYGDRECKYTEESDPAEVCEPPYALDEYHKCALEDLKPPVLRCPYEYQKTQGEWCLKEEGERTPRVLVHHRIPERRPMRDRLQKHHSSHSDLLQRLHSESRYRQVLEARMA